MKPRSHRVCCVLFGALLAPGGAAQERDASRFLAVESWVGVVNVVHGTTKTGGYELGGGFERLANRMSHSSQATLTLSERSNGGWTWRHGSGDPSPGRASVSARRSDLLESNYRSEHVEDSGSATFEIIDAELEIRPPQDGGTGTYAFGFAAGVTLTGTTTIKELVWESSSRQSGWKTEVLSNEWTYVNAGGHVYSEPLPDHGMTLSGSTTLTDSSRSGGTMNPRIVVETTTISWSFVPENLEVPEVVVTIPSYGAWIPEGTTSELAPGNGLSVMARLQTPTGEPPKIKAKRFVFDLVDMSREPGVAMNFPEGGLQDPPHPDLQFDWEVNHEAGLAPTLSGEFSPRAEVAEEGLTEATVIFSAFDWGAHGLIQVSAELADGTTVLGRLDTDPSRILILLPKRRDGSWIADPWREAMGVADAHDGVDEDAEPAGDGHEGDGLALYEEYRGFFASRRHTRTDPRRKDFFVLDLIKGRARQGIAMFADASGLDVHVLDQGEMSTDTRIINPNQSGAPRVVEQHGIILEGDGDPNRGYAKAHGSPSTPGNVTKVTVPLRTYAPGPQGLNVVRRGTRKILTDLYAATIAHELLHCCNVYRHGEDEDAQREWKRGTDEGVEVIFEARSFDDENETPGVIQVCREGGTGIPPRRFPNATKVYIGTAQGTHSGVEDCLMRYDAANAYRARSAVNKRYVVREMTGIGLCSQIQGTGVNRPERTPQPRYGDADAALERGSCKRQICVNDLHDHPPGERSGP